TVTAMIARNRPLNSAPRISASPHPKVWAAVAGRALMRCDTKAINTPPTAENVWKASEITATEPDQKPTTSSMRKYMPVSHPEMTNARRSPVTLCPPCALPLTPHHLLSTISANPACQRWLATLTTSSAKLPRPSLPHGTLRGYPYYEGFGMTCQLGIS